MRDTSRIAYAQARIQARFSARPREAFWRALEAGRDLQHLIEIVRGSPARDAVESLAAAVDPHLLEARLAGRWTRTCDEIAGWYPASWQPAMRWLAWLPWLPVLAWLANVDTPDPWMHGSGIAGDLARHEPPERAAALEDGPLASFAGAWRDGTSLSAAWHVHWQRTWPDTSVADRHALERLDAVLTDFVPGAGAPTGPGFDALVNLAEPAARRVFRRRAGTPVAGLALLVLLALDQMRLRAALALARSFGPGGTA